MCVCAFSYLLKLNVWRLSHPVMHPKQPFKVSILSHDHWWVGAQQHVLRLASVPICSWDCLFKLLPTFYLRYQWLVEHLTVSRTPNLPIHVSRITCLTHFLGFLPSTSGLSTEFQVPTHRPPVAQGASSTPPWAWPHPPAALSLCRGSWDTVLFCKGFNKTLNQNSETWLVWLGITPRPKGGTLT